MTAQTFRTLKLSRKQEDELYSVWRDTAVAPPAYAKWQLRPENCVITCYESGKTVFQGKDADIYASPFMDIPEQETYDLPDTGDILPQAGSDEVGTGDYFGPVCVCAAIVRKEDMELIRSLGVRDSKKLKDEEIVRIAPQLMKQLAYSLLIVDNATYNRVHESDNLNSIKAKLHNQAYVNLMKKTQLPAFRVIDQFTPERSYYRYISHEPKTVRGIHFETKAEDHYPAVGAASLIARYAFLRSMDAMKEKWGMEFQKGAGKPADQCAKEFVSRHGIEKLGEVAKLHFKNTEKLKAAE